MEGGQTEYKTPDYVKSTGKFLPMAVKVEKVQNVHGSTAGAGSGDFHQYRQLRRKERYRLVRLEAEARRTAQAEELDERRKDRVRETENTTLKKSNKRRARKMR